jgi:hypothetical protein
MGGRHEFSIALKSAAAVPVRATIAAKTKAKAAICLTSADSPTCEISPGIIRTGWDERYFVRLAALIFHH